MEIETGNENELKSVLAKSYDVPNSEFKVQDNQDEMAENVGVGNIENSEIEDDEDRENMLDELSKSEIEDNKDDNDKT